MTHAMTLPCPVCSGTGTDTHEDRHTETNRDTCRTCGGTGKIAARTGESPDASFGFVNQNTTATTGKDFPKAGMSFPGSENGSRTALTEAGQKVFDVLVKARAAPPSWIYWPGHAAALNAAAEILMPAEGAGLREAVWYGKDRLPDAGRKFIALWDDGSGAALLYRHDEGYIDSNGDDYDFLNASLDRWAYLPSGIEFRCELVSEDGQSPMRLPSALASPQPAVEGPVATGVSLEDACEPWSFSTGEPPDYDSPLSGVFGAGMAYTESLLAKLLDVSFYEGGDGSEDFDCDATMTLVNILAAAGLYDKDEGLPVRATLTPPADPKPTVPGNDAGMREIVGESAFVYILAHKTNLDGELWITEGMRQDWRHNPKYETSIREIAYLIAGDAISLASQTGSAGEDPKTPDAGMGERCPIGLDHTPGICSAGTCKACAIERLAQPAPVGEDETGVRKTLTLIRDYAGSSSLVRNDALDHIHGVAKRALANQPPKADPASTRFIGDGLEPRPWCELHHGKRTTTACPVCGISGDLAACRGPVPEDGQPKAETPAGVGEARAALRKALALDIADIILDGGAISPYAFASHLLRPGSALADAALSAAPAARPGDGFVLVPREPTEEMIEAAVKGSRADVSYDDVEALWPAMIAAAPAADGGRA